MDKHRIHLENSHRYPRSVFWSIEEYDEKRGYYRGVKSGVVSFFGKKAAIRAAKRALKKRMKRPLYSEVYHLNGKLFQDEKVEENLWQQHTCPDCKEVYSISKRALTGKYMIADHKKECSGLPGHYKGNAYCVKCKESVDFVGKIKTSDSGRRIAMGTCPNCKTKVNRILPSVGSSK